MFPAYLLLSSFSLAYDPETVCDGAGDLPTGDVFEIPNASDSAQPTWNPSVSTVVYSVQSFDGPDTAPGMSPIDVETRFGASPLPFAERADLPTSCNDRRWFRSAAWMAAESSPSGCYSTAAASPE
jgi:hypothetical protein